MPATLYNHFFSDFYHSFYYLALIFSVLTGLISIPFSDKGFKAVSLLLVITFISEIVAKCLVSSAGFSNNIVYHIFTPIEFLLYAIVYNYFLKSQKWKKILITFVVFMIICEVTNSIFLQGLKQTNTNTIILESIMLIILSLRLFLKIREAAIFQNILHSGIFWFNSAVLIYYSINILVWGFHSIKVYQLINPPTIIYKLLLLLSGLLYITFAVSILLHVYYKKIIK